MMTFANGVAIIGIWFALSSIAQADTETKQTLKFERTNYVAQAADGSYGFLFSAKKALSPPYAADEKATSFTLRGQTYNLFATKEGDSAKISLSEYGSGGKVIFEETRTSESLQALARDGVTIDMNGVPLKLTAGLSFDRIDTISYHVPEYGTAAVKLGNDKVTTVAAFSKSGSGLTSPPDISSRFLVDFNKDGLYEGGSVEDLELGESVDYFGYNYRLEADAEGNIVFVTVKLPKEYAANKSLWVIGEPVPEFTFKDEAGELRASSDIKGKFTYLSIGRKPSVFFQTLTVPSTVVYHMGRTSLPIIGPEELRGVVGMENLVCAHLEIPGRTINVSGVKTGFEEVDKEFPTWTAEDWSQDMTLFTLSTSARLTSYGTSPAHQRYHVGSFPAVHEVMIDPDGKLAAISVYNQKRLPLINYLVKYRDVHKALELFNAQLR